MNAVAMSPLDGIVIVDDLDHHALNGHPVIGINWIHKQQRYVAPKSKIRVFLAPAHRIQQNIGLIATNPHGGLVWIVPLPLTHDMLAVTGSSSSLRWPSGRSSSERPCSRLPIVNEPLWPGGVTMLISMAATLPVSLIEGHHSRRL
jgi:hypothetical protein